MTLAKLMHQKQQLDLLKNFAKIAAESKQYQAMTESSLLNLMLSAKDMGISPMKAINGGFYVVNGKVCMSTALMADRIRKAGHSIKIKAMTKDKCIIHATRKDNGDEISYEYTMEDASLAGLNNSPTWKKFPKQMLYNRCMSSVARILFSDVVGNSYSEEERFDIANVPAEERPLEDAEAELTVSDDTILIPEQLTEAQCAQLDALLHGHHEISDKICSHFEIKSIYEIKPIEFDKVVRSIERQIKKKGGLDE